jgi:UDP-N-acetylmuramyl pentapeptide phosphotransferase/UDP-N-acetylglucosamine-1-phosphate transferase
MIIYYFKICSVLLSSFFLLDFITKKFKILRSKFFSKHQQLAGTESIPLIGGAIFFIYLLFNGSFYNELMLYFCLPIVILGILSDIDYLKSPRIRFVLQILIILVFVSLSKLQIIDLRIDYLNKFFSNFYFSLLFTSFCLLILLNGSNFIDGLNGLNLGYFLLVLITLIIASKVTNFNIDEKTIISLLIIFIFLLFLNLCNFLYIGDSGAYLIGFVIGILIIETHLLNPSVSPYFFALLLWYPAFENFFSIIRKKTIKLDPTEPDTNHLHQLIYKLLNNKNYSNIFASIIINFYNLAVFLTSIVFMDNTLYLSLLLFINIFVYLMTYFICKKNINSLLVK